MPSLTVGASKREFLTVNRQAIEEMLADVETSLTDAYGPERVPVTLLDVWVITYCEAGITASGKVDPSFVHSEGEVGLYPLPSNIKSWNGPTAPRHDVQSPIEVNAFHYYLYLGHLKNKVVKHQDGVALYRDLFRNHGLVDPSQVNATLLAGVVHGYFFAGNYDDDRVPLQHLLVGFRAGFRLEDIMATTSYKHAGSTILINRARNIMAAGRDYAEYI